MTAAPAMTAGPAVTATTGESGDLDHRPRGDHDRRSRRRGGGAAGAGPDRDLADWSVGGRSLGLILTLVLMAGETYTSLSYLGLAGWSYTNGISALYVAAYLSVGMSISYLVGPLLWNYAREHNLLNISDIVAHRFGSPGWAL